MLSLDIRGRARAGEGRKAELGPSQVRPAERPCGPLENGFPRLFAGRGSGSPGETPILRSGRLRHTST